MPEGLARQLHQLSEAVTQSTSPEEAAQAMRDVPVDAAALTAHATLSDDNYTRTSLLESELAQVLLLAWMPGQGSPIHSHGESTCAVRVVQGVATESCHGADPDAPGHVTELPSGSVTSSSPGDCHQLRNDGVDPLYTLHVYSPPLPSPEPAPAEDVGANSEDQENSGSTQLARSPASAPKLQDRPAIQPARFMRKLLILAILILSAGAGIWMLDGLERLAPQLLMAVALAHATELVHECLHGLATGRKRVDYAIGTFLATATGLSFWFYSFSHFWHHRFNGTSHDRESFSYFLEMLESPKRTVRITGAVLHFSQVTHWLKLFESVSLAIPGRLEGKLRAETPRMPVSIAKKIQRNYRWIGAVAATAIVVAVTTTIPVVALIVVPLLIWGPIHALVETPEHVHTDDTSEEEIWTPPRRGAHGSDLAAGHHGDPVLRNTRSIRAGRLMQWFTNYNACHVAHHMDARVPMNDLPLFEEQLRAVYGFAHDESSYAAFYGQFFRKIFAGDGSVDALGTKEGR